MPRFFISFRRGGVIFDDEEGIDVPNLEVAHEKAFASGREILSDEIKHASEAFEAIIITDESRRELATIMASDLLPESLKK